MKKIWYFIRNIFMGIFVLFALILSPFIIALRQPFLYFAYRKSHFFRDTGTKYNVFITDSDTFRLYELIRKQELPILYLMPKDSKHACDGWFMSGTTLLIHNLPALFYEKRLGGWTAYPEDEEPLSETIAQILQRLREDHPDTIITNIRILMEFSESAPEDRKRAEQDPLFLLYSGEEQMLDVLRNFCTNA